MEIDNVKYILNSICAENENIMLWIGHEDQACKQLTVKMEEFRTIMGYTVTVLKNDTNELLYNPSTQRNGDDLCENLYRFCIGQQMRYGHVNVHDNKTIFVSNRAIQRAKKFYEASIRDANYKIVTH